MIRQDRIIIHFLRLDRSILITRRLKPHDQDLNDLDNNNRSRALKSRVQGLNIRPIRRLRNLNQILQTLRRDRTKAAIKTNLNTITRPVKRLNSLPLPLTNTANKTSRRQNFPDNDRDTSRLALIGKNIRKQVPAQINRHKLIIRRLLMRLNRNLKTYDLNISLPNVALDLMPHTKDTKDTKRHRRTLVKLRHRSMLALNNNLLNNHSGLIDNLQRNSTRLLRLLNIMRMHRKTNILQRAMNLTASLRRKRQALDRIILMLHNLFNSILRRALARSLERLNMSSLDRVEDNTNLSINHRLLSRILDHTVRLNNLSLSIQIILIPLNRSIVSRHRTLFVQRTVRMNSHRLFIFKNVTTIIHRQATANGNSTRSDRQHRADGRSFLDCRVPGSSVRVSITSSS